MANRHLSRSIALQSLFEWDMRGKDKNAVAAILRRNADEFGEGVSDFPFIESLTHGVIDRHDDLNIVITKAAPEWPIDKISAIDRNVLRIGLFELLFSDRKEVPAKVAINEAIELAKSFGGETSGRFVNGVLGAVYKELGEPGKEETTDRIKRKDALYEKIPLEQLGGAVVFACKSDETYLAMVHDVFGHWTLSKGKLNAEEGEAIGAVRKIKEELGLDISIKEKLGENEYLAHDPKIGKKRKRVAYYLAESPLVELKLGTSGGLDDARWFKLADVRNLNLYEDLAPIVLKAINILLNKK